MILLRLLAMSIEAFQRQDSEGLASHKTRVIHGDKSIRTWARLCHITAVLCLRRDLHNSALGTCHNLLLFTHIQYAAVKYKLLP